LDEAISAAVRPHAERAIRDEAESATPEQSRSRREMPGMRYLFLNGSLAAAVAVELDFQSMRNYKSRGTAR
jgi:hypothetical protein